MIARVHLRFFPFYFLFFLYFFYFFFFFTFLFLTDCITGRGVYWEGPSGSAWLGIFFDYRSTILHCTIYISLFLFLSSFFLFILTPRYYYLFLIRFPFVYNICMCGRKSESEHEEWKRGQIRPRQNAACESDSRLRFTGIYHAYPVVHSSL